MLGQEALDAEALRLLGSLVVSNNGRGWCWSVLANERFQKLPVDRKQGLRQGQNAACPVRPFGGAGTFSVQRALEAGNPGGVEHDLVDPYFRGSKACQGRLQDILDQKGPRGVVR